MSRIIGIVGPARSGKDTTADLILSQNSDYEKYNLADPLKACVNDWLGWNETHGYGDQKEIPQAVCEDFALLAVYVMKHFNKYVTPQQAVSVARQMEVEFTIHKYTKDHHFFGEDRKEYYIVSPRQVYQWFGTDCMRAFVDDDIWLKLIPDTASVVLADVRFENEAKYARDHGIVIHLQRDDCIKVADHVSEAGVSVNKTVDYTLTNNGTIEDLSQELGQILKDYADKD